MLVGLNAIELGCVDFLYISEIIQFDGLIKDLLPPLHRNRQLSRTHGREVWDRFRRQFEQFRHSRHLAEDVHQLPVWMAEILFQPLNGENQLVGVAFFSLTIGRSWRTNDDFLSERYNLLCEAGGLRVHNKPSRFTP